MTTAFTKQELQTLCQGLDALIRNEGRAIADAGIVGVRQSIGQLNLRFVTALSAFDKAQELLAMPDEVQTIEPESTATAVVADAKTDKSTRSRAGNSHAN